MKLCVFTVCMPEYDMHETVRVLKELGYDGVEWRATSPAPAQKPADYTIGARYWTYNLSNIDIDKIVESAGEVKNLCDRAGLEIPSLATYLKLWDSENIERAMTAAHMMGCRNIRVLAPLYDEKEDYKSLFDRSRLQVKALEGLAGKHGVRILFEIHMGYIIPSASAAFRLVEGSDPDCIGIIYDPGNMVYEGFENYRLGVELLGEYLAHVHIKNGAWKIADIEKDGKETWRPLWVPYKKGMVDIGKVIGVLKGANYSGYLSVEDFSNEEDTYGKLKGNLQFLRDIIG